MYPDGDFVVVWASLDQDGSGSGVFGQRFHVDPILGPLCGDVASNDLRITASDALGALRAAVGIRECAPCVCDANASGTLSAADALLILQSALQAPGEELACSPCAA
jgi:hypothetical protein